MGSEQGFVISRMKELLNERNWTIYRLAKESGIPYSSLNNIFVRETTPSVPTLEKICEGFDITMSQFFDNEFFSGEKLSASEQKLILRFRKLSNDDKKLLDTFLSGLSKSIDN